jgi:hypothetical protein
MISAETASEAVIPLRFTSSSPARGNMEVFTNWNKNKQPANMSKP